MSRMESTVGFRFHPTDEELVDYYLRLKRLGKDSQVKAIPQVDLYQYEPSDLPKLSVIRSDDPEWFFFCLRDFKYSKSTRTNRATKSGYWKPTGKDRKIKARRNNKVIGTKKTLVFHRGRNPNGARTNWVMHEYHPAATLSNQKDFVLCRIMKKPDETDVSTCDEGEASSYTASDFDFQAPDDSILEVYIQPEADLETLLQPIFPLEDFDFAPSLQSPGYNPQGVSFMDSAFINSYNNERDGMQFRTDTNEQEEEFVNSLIADLDENSRAPESLQKVFLLDGGPSSDTDTDTAQARYDHFLETSLFNEHFGPKEFQQMQMGTVCSSSSNHDQYREGRNGFLRNDLLGLDASINRLSSVRTESPPKVRTSTPQHQRRLRQFPGHRVAQKRFQLQSNSSHRVVFQGKAKDALRDSTTADPPRKEKSDSDKEQKMAQGTNAKKSLNSTTFGSAGSNQKGYFIFVETPLLSHGSSPPSVYFGKVLLGTILFLVFIREVVLYGNWC